MDVRQEFLDFFKNKGHEIISSMPLVPNDTSLMFVNAGMVQFKDIFIGEVPRPKNPKATSCQLCIRAGGKHNDLENVGYTARHHTLFEMLGNFSFGDYFKKDAIAYAWEFITINLELPIDKLWVTIHNDDDEAYELWKKHISEDRIKRFGDKDNFWSMGNTGACGPCSEIFYDQGSKNFDSNEDYLGGEGDRFLEIWNLVFMQYEKNKSGELIPLPKPSIDTGMGLERVIAIKEGVLNNFDSSNFQPLIKKVEQLCGKKHTPETIGSYRVIADHLRATSFMLSQGILFDKEGRGYVLRRILRRCVRHGYLLGLKKPFMADLVDTLCDILGNHYTQIVEQKSYIKEQLSLEEARFFKTIDLGMSLFNEELKNTKEIFSGTTAFKLYDTFGFPLDLTQDMLRQTNISIDINKFDTLMQEQKTKAKASWKGINNTSDGAFKKLLDKYGTNTFIGYSNVTSSSKVLALLDENFKEVSIVKQGQSAWVILDKTPFYAQSGGQIGDIGAIETHEKIIMVTDTQIFHNINMSKIIVENQFLSKNEIVTSVVVNRYETSKHHSATHLLQAALKIVLGDNVSQAGSLNEISRLRFDFTYEKAMSQTQINEVEDLVNSMISRGLKTSIQELCIKEAKKSGAIAMFGEKYGDIVRVINFGDISIELCGGTHVKNTADISSFYITKESGVSAGVRRIEAVCGSSAINYTNNIIKNMNELKHEVKNNDVLLGIKKLKADVKQLKTRVNEMQEQSTQTLNEIFIDDVKIIVDIVKNGDIKKIVDDLKNANQKLAVLLLQKKGDKVMIVAGCKNTKINAGLWIKKIAPILGGNGGGRADFAQAGGKHINKIDEAKTQALSYVNKKEV